MPNLTISLDEDLMKSGRRYAEKNKTSLNGLIRKLLEDTIASENSDWLEECFALMDRAGGDSGGRKWRREDLYDG